MPLACSRHWLQAFYADAGFSGHNHSPPSRGRTELLDSMLIGSINLQPNVPALAGCIVTLLLGRFSRTLRSGPFWPLHALQALPSTFLHELAHWLMGWLCFARPAGLHLMPRRVQGALVLGRTTFYHLQWWNAPLVALAPLGLLPLGAGLVLLPIGDPMIAFGCGVAAGLLLQGGLPSRSDGTGRPRTTHLAQRPPGCLGAWVPGWRICIGGEATQKRENPQPQSGLGVECGPRKEGRCRWWSQLRTGKGGRKTSLPA